MARLWIEGAAPAAPWQTQEYEGALLAEAIRRVVPFFSLPCGGRQSCGKCLVWAKGALSRQSDEEALLLAGLEQQAPEGYVPRLACFCRMEGDVWVKLPAYAGEASAAAFARLPLPTYDGGRPAACGIACDLGTTTITLALYQMDGGRVLATAHEMNAQGAYGADVLSRIDYSNAHGPEGLSMLLCRQLGRMLDDVLHRGQTGYQALERLVVTGNTTMLHFVAGLNPKGIGVTPYTPASLFGEALPAAGVFPRLAAGGATLYLPPCISAYVGADISCGLIALEFDKGAGTRLLVDVGTNGEMALVRGGKVFCCAAAAGPAFEGGQITMGMPATRGAISKVAVRNDRLECSTIGGAPAAGICGTGLISAIGALLACGAVDSTGRMLCENHPLVHLVERRAGGLALRLAPGIFLTQLDIRAAQLAKAAIAAGVDILLRRAGVAAEDVEQLCLAGGFGSVIDPGEAAAIGLIPAALAAKTVSVGNAALAGAAAMVFSMAARQRAALLAKQAEEIPLSLDPDFMDAYVENMAFGGGREGRTADH